MATLSPLTLKVYDSNWAYVKPYISNILIAESTINELKSIKSTARGKPVSLGILKNYISAVMYQVRDNTAVRDLYAIELRKLKLPQQAEMEKQEGTEMLRDKLTGLTWEKVIEYKNKILESKSISDENKLLIRLYLECDAPVRNDFSGLRVFLDEAKPLDWTGNCLLLTESPVKIAPRRKFVVKKTVGIVELPADGGGIAPIRNLMWLQDFKTAKHDCQPDIIQSIPIGLANDLINYCKKHRVNVLFNTNHYALSKRIISMFYQVSERRIGINVLRHLYIMAQYKDAPMLHTRKQTAKRMGHSVSTQELYRIRCDLL